MFEIFTIKELSLIVIAVMNGMLAFVISKSGRKNPVNIWFSILALSLVFWAIMLVFYLITSDRFLAIFFLKLAYGATIVSALSFYLFAHYFPERTKFNSVLVTVSTVALVGYIALPGKLIRDVILVQPVHIGVHEQVGFWLFFVYFLFGLFGPLVLLYRRWQTAVGDTRTHIGYIIWSILTAGIFGVFFNLVLPSPVFGIWNYIWLGPLFTALIVIAVSYAVTKHQLLNIRILGAEMLATSVVFLLFLEFIFSRTFGEALLRLFFFLIVAFFSVSLVRSVEREVRQRDELDHLSHQLLAANSELKKLDQAKSEFISIAAHQLRAPLTVIRGYISMLREGSFGAIPNAGKDALQNVETAAGNLINLVNSLLNLSRIESGTLQYQFQKHNFAEIVSAAVEELRLAAHEQGFALQFANNAQDMPSFFFDADKIREVAINYIDNAVKYSVPGAGTVEVVLERARGQSGDVARLSVLDHGVGVNEEDARLLFVKLSRLPDAKKIDPNGMGIGLYFVKRIVEDHGGRVGVMSEGRGKGSVFFAELPIREKPASMNNAPQGVKQV